MAGGDRERWNERWTRVGPKDAPDPWIRDMLVHTQKGRALDVACGTGRHSLMLAKLGWNVTSLDVSDVAIAQLDSNARDEKWAIDTRAIDLESDPIPKGPFDLIVDSHYLQRSLFPQFIDGLTTGGVLIFVQPTTRNLERHPSPSARFLVGERELERLVGPLQMLVYEEGWNESGRHEARCVAKKPAP